MCKQRIDASAVLRAVVCCGVAVVMMYAIPGLAQAGLTWKQQSVTLQAEPGIERLKADFAFENTGDTSITIESLTAECNCTTAQLDKATYAPGETGVVSMVFEPGDRRGPQIKQVVVATDDPDRPRTMLEMRVSIRERVQVRPRLLMWSEGEAREPKEAVVTVLGREPMAIRLVKENIQANHADTKTEREMSVVLTVDEVGRTYRVTVSPPRDTSTHRMEIQLAGDIKEGQHLRPLRILARTVGSQGLTAEKPAPGSDSLDGAAP